MTTDWISLLKNIFNDHQLLTDPASCTSYSYDNGRHRAIPAAVALPENATQVQSLVRVCATHRIPITARGRATGTPGGAIPTPHGLALSFERMDKILTFCPKSRYIVVEPGVLNHTVQTLAASEDLFWPVDPSSQTFSSIGGNLGYNTGGPHTLKYGAARENVLYIEAITGAGDFIKTGFPITKSSSGYDLTKLIIGSEGTLALITKACLKLLPKTEASVLLQAWFNTEPQACEAIEALMHQPLTPAAVEFMDSHCLDLLRQQSSVNIPPGAQAMLLIELVGFSQELPGELAMLKKTLHSALPITEPSSSEHAWAARKALSPILRKFSPYKINEDIVVPVDQLANFLSWLHDITAQKNLLNVNFGHAGNGNIHVNLLPQSAEEISLAENLLTTIFDKVMALGGTLSGEHGIGLDKKPFLAKAYSKETLALMRAIKDQFDPYHILNPDKLLPA